MRFVAALKRLGAADDKLLVGVSGGADSLSLLLMAQVVLGERCHAATVDHGLRPESADEARFVGRICAERGIPHTTLSAAMPERAGKTANISSRARLLRYRLLEAHARAIGAPFVATAHHADDQLETLVMRLNRGAGVSGLAGIRARSGMIVRPLLDFRAHELAGLPERFGITPVSDPTNLDDRFDRARLRKRLSDAEWLDRRGASASASALDDADRALDWAADCLQRELVSAVGDQVVLRSDGLPFELTRRLVSRCLLVANPMLAVSGGDVVRLIKGLETGAARTLGGVTVKAGKDAAGKSVITFRAAPPRRR